MGEKVVSIFTGLIGVATIAVLVGSTNTAKIFQAGGSAFATAVKAAMGK